MRNRKLERALYGPTVYEITFGVVLSCLLGAVLAVAFLVFKPAQVVEEMPKEDERLQGVTYYVAGTADATRGKQWMRKRQMLLESTAGEIVFTEDDLNTWLLHDTPQGKKAMEKAAKAAAAAEAAAKQPAKPAPKPAKAGQAAAPAPEPAPAAEPAEAPPEELISYTVPNFRIRDGLVQLGMPCTVNTLGYQFPVVVQAKGGFEKRDDMYVYVPDELMVGSLPLHRFPNAVEYVIKRALASDALSPDLLSVWKKVKTVVVDGKTLKVTI
jgi:hypothetical protein